MPRKPKRTPEQRQAARAARLELWRSPFTGHGRAHADLNGGEGYLPELRLLLPAGVVARLLDRPQD